MSARRLLARLYDPARQIAAAIPTRPVTRNPPHHVRTPLYLITGPLTAPTRSISGAVRPRAVPHRNSFAKVRFSAADVPPLPLWVERARDFRVADDELATPAACRDACVRYAALAIEDKPRWRERMLSTSSSPATGGGSQIPLYTLHYAATMLAQAPVLAGHLSTHILHSAVLLGYAPSVLTLARLGLRRGLLDSPHFAAAREALEKLARVPGRGKPDPSGSYYRPDALTLLGLAQAEQKPGTTASADRVLRYFEDAALAFAAAGGDGSNPDAVSWQWRISAILAQTPLYTARGDTARAKEVLRVGTYELDSEEACFQYAQLLTGPEEEEERTNLLRRAAISGVEGAARELGRQAEQEAEREGLGARERRDARFLADEWAGIAGDKAILS
ncbi:hypothetical protein AAE478_003942 [Parahypoxylon ruwenzoriense]